MTTLADVCPIYNRTEEFYDKYDLKELLGRGQSSVVKRCIEKKSGQSFACKIIEYPEDTSETKESTHNEISILRAAGKHTNIISIHDAFELEDCAFIVMEFCNGGELFDYLTKVVRLSEKKARAQMKLILNAVNHLHKHNIVHRDLKPENILIDDNYNLKITDLGLSVQIDGDSQQLRESCGYGKPVDMWACGVILYTMLSGFPPFWHRKEHILLRMIMDGKYSFNNVIWEEISDDAKSLISGLLTFDPIERLTSEEALNHRWFTFEVPRRKDFVARRVLKAHIIVVWSILRMKTLHSQVHPIKTKELLINPYKFKTYRNVIDSAAFDIYAHWVNKAGNQNRAALFESEISHITVEA
ncbi:hypothetical protein GJ496_000395 [Pomphorhynchus laevis]|nr:hypothetical protein GJ496_000395 [Pomphorhynchus laevis]